MSYIALAIGVICFLITFVPPIRIVMIDSLIGDYMMLGLTVIGCIRNDRIVYRGKEMVTDDIVDFIAFFSHLFCIVVYFTDNGCCTVRSLISPPMTQPERVVLWQ